MATPDLPTETDVAVLGAGPIGLDAGLALAETGRAFVVLEAGSRPAAAVRHWGGVPLFSPWSLNLSQRMRACLGAEGFDQPEDDRCPTGKAFCDAALDPIARSRTLAGHLHTGVRVRAVGREGLLKSEEIGTSSRSARRFRLLLETEAGERVLFASAVLDCTGIHHQPNWLGRDGIPALGEIALVESGDPRLVRTLGRFLERDWHDREVLLVGSGHSAQTAAVALAEEARAVTWLLRGDGSGLAPIDADPLPERSRLQSRAGALLRGDAAGVAVHTHAGVDALRPEGERLRVRFSRRLTDTDVVEEESVVDAAIALVGSTGDQTLYRELQVQECYATGGPMRLAAALLGETDPDGAGDCLAQTAKGAEALVTPEPGYFILGNKSYGRNSAFLLRIGYSQVDDALTLL